MNKTSKNIISILSIFALIAVVFTSCGKKEKTRVEILNEAIAANDFRTCDSILVVSKDACDSAWDLKDI